MKVLMLMLIDRHNSMALKSLVYSRSEPVLSTQQQLPADSVKSLVYSRIEPSVPSQLEGTSFESKFNFTSKLIPSKLQCDV